MFHSRHVLLFACWALVFFALIGNASTTFININALIENERRVAHTHEVKERLNSLLTNFVDTESGIRGFIIAEHKEFLKPYQEAERRIADEFRIVTELVKDNPAQQSAIVEVRRLRDKHREFLIEAMTAVDNESAAAAQAIIKSGRGKAIMDEIRLRIADMTVAEDQLLVERARIAKDRYRETMFTAIFGTGLSVVTTLLALLVVWRELRRRRIAETALKIQVEETRLNTERFRLLSETAPVHIWLSDTDGTATFLNRSWREYTGLSGNALGIADWMSAIHPEDAGRLQTIWNRNQGGEIDLYVDDVRVRRAADQSYRWHRCAIVPVRTRAGALQSWVGTLADIHDQKEQSEALEQAVGARTLELQRANNSLNEEVIERMRAEERVNAAAGELRRSNQELEQFAYVASHDLQEPLRKIQAFGDRLLRKCRDQLNEQGQVYLDRMLAAATRMRTLIDDLLAFSRVATTFTPFVPVDLQAIVEGVVGDLETRLAQSEGRVETKALPTIRAEPLQMRQLVQNLLANALKFAKPGEPPVVSIEATRLESLTQIADPPPSSPFGWRLTFADHGIGFDQVHVRRIFELFQRLHSRDQYEGTGIGLAICKKIVERHGGVIHARGQLGVGATFFVDLPDAAKETSAAYDAL